MSIVANRRHYRASHAPWLIYNQKQTNFRTRPTYLNEETLTVSNDKMTKVVTDMRVGLSTNAESNLLWFSTITATAPHLHTVELAVKLTSGRDLAFYTLTGRLRLMKSFDSETFLSDLSVQHWKFLSYSQISTPCEII